MKKSILLLLPFVLLWASCEEVFEPAEINAEVQIVVEGQIEAMDDSDLSLPPYVILTRTIPFHSEITTEEISELFVHDADVRVLDDNTEYELSEVCWEDVPPELRPTLIGLLPDNIDTIPVNACLYLDLSFTLQGEIGKTYDLIIETEDERLTSSTTIPPHTPFDSLHFIKAPGEFGDDFYELRCFMSDPVELADFYRYFTSTNGEFLVAGFSSVVDDALFNGQSFEFPLARANPKFGTSDSTIEPGEDPPDPRILGLFNPGDEVIVKWTNIDEAHFMFWESLEFNIINQTPFGSYTRINSNIEGGVGIWGGYSGSYYSLTAPE